MPRYSVERKRAVLQKKAPPPNMIAVFRVKSRIVALTNKW